MNSFFSALQFLTLFPWPKRVERRADEIGPAAIFFPIVGFFLGSILALANFLLEPFASAILISVVVVTLLALLTRGLHLDGLGDTFDGLGAGGDRERMLRIMDDSHTGAFGLIAIVLVLFFKIHAIESLDSERWRALLVRAGPEPLGNGTFGPSLSGSQTRIRLDVDRPLVGPACVLWLH